MHYQPLTDAEYALYAPELQGFGHILVSDGQTMWKVKYKPGSPYTLQRELLGFALARKVSNVAEVKALTDCDLQEIRAFTPLDRAANASNTYLVRLVGSYTVNELPHQTLEDAVAAELVYSLWTRRRDTHVDNRAYVDGVPIYFDHEICFLAEPHFAQATAFFGALNDYGHAGFWRVKQVDRRVTTEEMRSLYKPTMGAYHYVHDIAAFQRSVTTMTCLLKATFDTDLTTTITAAGFDTSMAEVIHTFLHRNLATLDSDMELMKDVIFRP